MMSIKAAENFQTGCIASLTAGEHGPSREMMCAIVDGILGRGPEYVMFYGGDVDGMNFLRTYFMYDIAKGTWRDMPHYTYVGEVAAPVHRTRKYKLAATGSTIGFVMDFTIAMIDVQRMRIVLRNSQNGINPHLTGNENMVVMPNGDLYMFHAATFSSEHFYLFVAKAADKEWTQRSFIPGEFDLCQQYGIALDERFVLLVGGYDTSGVRNADVVYMLNAGPTQRCLLYDTGSGVFSEAGAMNMARTSCKGCILPNGHVFISGGVHYHGEGFAHLGNYNEDHPLQGQAEIYSPPDKKWSLLKGKLRRRSGHTCTLIAPNLVLIAGGWVGHGKQSAANRVCEIYNLDDDSVTETGSLPQTVYHGVAVPVFGCPEEKSTQHVGN